VLVTGATGQLGQAIAARFGRTRTVIALGRADLDVTRADDVRRLVADHAPSVIVNCVAFNQVDLAQKEAEEALAVNAFAVRNLARAAIEAGATLVHYSTDFVFDGETDRPYREDDPPSPRSVYAASKLMGEWFAAEAPRHYVLRVESLFGGLEKMSGSFDKIIGAIAAGDRVRVFVDRVVSPSYVWDVVAATRALLERAPDSGVYHCANTGHATWAALAEYTARRLGGRARLEHVRMADVPLPAARPRYCALANDKLLAAGIAMPPWQEALDRYLVARGLVAAPEAADTMDI
jgi:dTDP-4-dehydrorhamnose reductase